MKIYIISLKIYKFKKSDNGDEIKYGRYTEDKKKINITQSIKKQKNILRQKRQIIKRHHLLIQKKLILNGSILIPI